jgi:Asp-tRNA(Asn)/Glu-tRNA(Gln) amidotransferase A subunit family amidase
MAISLTGKLYREDILLSVAEQFEQALGVAKQTPPDFS